MRPCGVRSRVRPPGCSSRHHGPEVRAPLTQGSHGCPLALPCIIGYPSRRLCRARDFRVGERRHPPATMSSPAFAQPASTNVTEPMSIVRRRAVLAVGLVALAVALAPGGVRPPVLASGPVDQAIQEQQRLEAALALQRQKIYDLRRQQAELTVSLVQLSVNLRKAGLELASAKRELARVTEQLGDLWRALRVRWRHS